MGHPDKQWFSPNELAIRWDESKSYVENLITDRQFPHIFLEGEQTVGVRRRHIYFGRSLWKHEGCTNKDLGNGEIATLLPERDGPWRLPEPNVRIYIPLSVIEAFEQQHDI